MVWEKIQKASKSFWKKWGKTDFVSKSKVYLCITKPKVLNFPSRVESSGKNFPDVPPLQSVRAVFPHTAFLRFSPQAFTSYSSLVSILSGRSSHIWPSVPQRLYVCKAYSFFGSFGCSIDILFPTDIYGDVFWAFSCSLFHLHRSSLTSPLGWS